MHPEKSSEIKRIAFTGSTGHLGSVLIPMLIEQGYLLNCLYRRNRLSLESSDIEWVKGDLKEAEKLESLFKDAYALIHCASVISIGEDNQDDLYEINVNATQKLIDHCVEKKARLVYISSSTATLPDNPERVLDERSPRIQSKEFFYGWTKARAEELVLSAVADQGLDAIILRPTALIGPPDEQPSRFGRTILDLYTGKLPMISSGGYDLVDIRDFSQTVINSLKKAQKGEVFVTGGKFYSLKELAEAVNPSRIPPVISIDLLLVLLPLIRLYQKFVPLRWPINRESLMAIKQGPSRVDSSKAVEQLSHQFRPLQESVRDLIGWMKKNDKL
jgi:dihydroflavonol-4-reductase